MKKFIGREEELKRLKWLYKQPGAKFAVIRGRRRIGKSRLIKESLEGHNFIKFMGLPPDENTTADIQRENFLKQLARQRNIPNVSMNDWGDIFHYLNEQIKHDETVIVFDEISWMASKDNTFLGKLKTAWDEHFSSHSNLTLILCGSISSWIEKNILSSTGFLGRPTLLLTVRQLPIDQCIQFWGKVGEQLSAYEKLKILSVTGGVPRYLELVDPTLSAEKNIQQWCFHSDGILLNEFKHIFSDIFSRKSGSYQQIVDLLVDGPKSQEDIRNALKLSKSGDLSERLSDLTQAGFISRDHTWSTASGDVGKLSKYRLKDNYMRFYLKYISPNKTKIEKELFSRMTLNQLPNWYSILGLQFENLVIHNRLCLFKLLGFNIDDVVFDNPYFQRKTERQDGCQIDYMIQTKFDTLFVCEIKFSRNAIGRQVIEQVKDKVDRLSKPKFLSVRTVLIHVNGVDKAVKSGAYFSHIIDFSNMVETQ